MQFDNEVLKMKRNSSEKPDNILRQATFLEKSTLKALKLLEKEAQGLKNQEKTIQQLRNLHANQRLQVVSRKRELDSKLKCRMSVK